MLHYTYDLMSLMHVTESIYRNLQNFNSYTCIHVCVFHIRQACTFGHSYICPLPPKAVYLS